MDESMKRYLFFAVTKGKKPGVYCGWEDANEQVVSYIFPEFHGFNSYEQALLAFNSRMSSIHAENSAKAEMVGSLREGGGSSRGSRRRPIVSWIPVIPQEELEWNFAIVNDMEEWLVKVCHESGIPGPCFFKQERYLEDSGPYFGFTVVIPGDPFEVELDVMGRFCLEEKEAREDAAVEMLGRVLEITGKEIRDFNYTKVKLLRDSNDALRTKIRLLEESYEKLKLSYQNLANAHIEDNSP